MLLSILLLILYAFIAQLGKHKKKLNFLNYLYFTCHKFVPNMSNKLHIANVVRSVFSLLRIGDLILMFLKILER